MIDLRNVYVSKRQQLVIDKYNAERIEDIVNEAQTDFWITIHDKLVMTESDESNVDIDDEIIYAVLDYIFDNDVELQEKWESTFN